MSLNYTRCAFFGVVLLACCLGASNAGPNPDDSRSDCFGKSPGCPDLLPTSIDKFGNEIQVGDDRWFRIHVQVNVCYMIQFSFFHDFGNVDMEVYRGCPETKCDVFNCGSKTCAELMYSATSRTDGETLYFRALRSEALWIRMFLVAPTVDGRPHNPVLKLRQRCAPTPAPTPAPIVGITPAPTPPTPSPTPKPIGSKPPSPAPTTNPTFPSDQSAPTLALSNPEITSIETLISFSGVIALPTIAAVLFGIFILLNRRMKHNKTNPKAADELVNYKSVEDSAELEKYNMENIGRGREYE